MTGWESTVSQERLTTTNQSGPDMTELGNCFMTMVSLYCDDDDWVITDNDITAGYWLIGSDPATNSGGVGTVDPAGDQWPHQVRDWKYYTTSGGWQSDPLLTVTGNININILCLNINIISTVEGHPGYPENLNVTDLTGDRVNLAGVYRRQGDSRVWKYGDLELSFNGKYWYWYHDNNHLYIIQW